MLCNKKMQNNIFDNGSSNSSDVILRDTFALTVGACYFGFGLIFIFLQLICAYLIQIDERMQNPTYKLVVNLCVADALELIPLGLYSGITILVGVQNPIVDRWMAFISNSAFYANCFLFVFIAYSRWVIICLPHLHKHLLRKNVMLILHAASWVPSTIWCFYGCILHDPAVFGYRPDLFSWGYKFSCTFGLVWHWIDFVFNNVMTVVEMTFNCRALYYVYKTRKHAERSFNISGNRRRETKLLIQCFVLGCIFTIANFVFTLSHALRWKSREAFLVMQAIWLFNHCVNPLVYFGVNSKLRKKFIRFVSCRKSQIQRGNGASNTNTSKK